MGEGLGRKTHCNNNKKNNKQKKTKTINNNKQQRKRNERNPELDAYRYIYVYTHIYIYIYNTILYYTILYRHGGLFHCFLTGSPSSRFYYQPTSLPLPSPTNLLVYLPQPKAFTISVLFWFAILVIWDSLA